MLTRQFLKVLVAGFFIIPSVFAESEVALRYRYKDAQTSQIESGEEYFSVNPNSNFLSDPAIEKTLLVIKMANSLNSWLINFRTSDEQPSEDCADRRLAIADQVLAEVAKYSDEIQNNLSILSDEKLFEVLDLFRKLAQNMKDYKEEVFEEEEFMPSYGALPVAGPALPPPSLPGAIGAARGSLGVTTGGAQDFAFVRKLINNGRVPQAESFDTKGFLGEFELSTSLGCDKLLCVEPLYKVDSANKKLFVQIALGTNVKEAEFKRKPLNLALVIDISGSMAATDDTQKSRLEWAKEAAIKTLAQLNYQDALSIVLFDDDSEVLLPMTALGSEENKAGIMAKISALETRGSTNLYAGIKSAYELVSQYAATHAGRENRLILISDAGLNTGIIDEATTLRLVSDYASEGIGLTAIGLGENFNQDFILGISKSVGGNYLYVHSGKDLTRYFESFDFLVSPVAFGFKASLDLGDLKATFANAYGLPMAREERPYEFINVQTLFFTSQGGGAMLLEYDLK